MKFRMNIMPLEIIPCSDTRYMARFYRARRLWSRPWGHIAPGRFMPIESSNDTTENRTLDVPACSSVPTASSISVLSLSKPYVLRLPVINFNSTN